MDPNSFAEHMYVEGMTARISKNMYIESFMCRKMGYRPTNMIAFRDDVYFYLLDYGFVPEEAWRLSERVRKGLRLEITTSDMVHARDRWVSKQIEKTRYLSCKAHILEKHFYILKARSI